ncbi:MAG TPA: TerC family protein, partial [Planctomycetota bacterium]|nr:TerC family protein [Planctomycetota bacterium]
EGEPHRPDPARSQKAVRSILLQIVLIDVVFSLDSVITAVGMARSIPVMIAAVVISVLAMMAFAGTISAFIERHPTMKMLALSFLLLVGVVLIVEGFGGHVGKAYVYSAMAFSLFVEFLNLRVRGKAEPVQLRARYEEGGARPS